MTTRQGSLALLQSPLPARLAYTWTDGTPRVVPIGFLWNGEELVFGTPTDAPKMRALRDGMRVAATIDTGEMPYKGLLIRGTVRTDVVEGVAPEYEAMTMRCLGAEQGAAWLTNLRAMTTDMARVYLTPDWVGIIDFETRFPSAIERAMERAAGAQ